MRVKAIKSIFRAKKILLLFMAMAGFLLLNSNLFAQINLCRDSTKILGPYNSCSNIFDPVCGCDGATYRNSCQALALNGILQYQSGICGAIDIDINPDPVVFFIDFKMVLGGLGPARVMIYDVYGQKYFERDFESTTGEEFDIDVTDFRTGIYYIRADTNGSFVGKKFVKIDFD